ncbi:TPA: plasmid mobilization relaxosome protein MobC [Klebsiella pneumoniae]|uniref:plasmid mobilization protein n=1 Tax=Klebsiella pneumoniae TaxID=573 RepID=UPI0018DB2BB0|nr:plasmid mobilization relaxosome protein MobC [Klebsiella pneumoniae]HBY0415885.1 plasmid mobilization relaxosome protein MobC [Klebsiella variicola]MBH8278817.1 plasmid mobilization relaxosome protein MobC [Klebsiella pneumoniae]HBR7659884.1 plasmid mobilization relaxosome protein MobC [Klebsiella pneumoniae]HBS7749900.1 plasmid mobilization relaxosome protein MobC [Klebsiella pneumoniae]HBS7753805.1 plasmid mobilization relaxosome protein MobC [Klebsiella pneumoniae]
METDRNRGRRKLAEHEVRNKTIQFRVNKEELDYLNDIVASSGLEKGHFIRRELLRVKPKRQPSKIPEINRETVRLINNIANNINQMAKRINSSRPGVLEINLADNAIIEARKVLMGIKDEIESK